MKIVVANQKGGAGKTTHCILLANYLVLEKKQEVLLIDMDFQATLKGLWEADQQNYSNKPLYEVVEADLSEAGEMMEQIKHVAGQVIIDLPGKIDDEHLVPVFQGADLVLIPFAYDKVSFESTYTFAQVVRHLNPKVPLVFIPNRLKAGVKYETKSQVNLNFYQYGIIAPECSDKVAFQRVDTLSIHPEIQTQVHQTYHYICERYLNKTLVS